MVHETITYLITIKPIVPSDSLHQTALPIAALSLYPVNLCHLSITTLGPYVTLGLTAICHIGPNYHIGPIIIVESIIRLGFIITLALNIPLGQINITLARV